MSMSAVASAPLPAEAAPRPLRALIIDDEPADRDRLADALRTLDCQVRVVSDRASALEEIRGSTYDLAFVDLMLGDESGLGIVPALLEADAWLQVVVATAFGSIDSAVQAVKAGASEYLRKPFDPEHLRALVQRASGKRRPASGGPAPGRPLLSSRSPAMQQVLAVIRQAAGAQVPVLLRGESGTGKGAMAEALHRLSPRASGPFFTINCPTLTDELLTSELFGHARGSFTGAVRDQMGKIEAADGGTLFLDELGDLPASIQVKLLRFLQERTYERVGETSTRHADVRIVAATNRDLEARVRDGRFREDLLYRLNVIEVTMPPLRERPEDILDLAEHFLARFCADAERPAMGFSPRATELLLRHPWPGNIRELRNELQRISVLWPTRTVDPESFSWRLRPPGADGPCLGGDHSLADIKNEHIRQVLAKAGSFVEAASLLDIEPSTLLRKRRSLGL